MRLCVFLFIFLPLNLISQVDVDFELLYSGYDRPVDISDPEDGSDRLFVVEQEGRIKIIENKAQLPVNFLDISWKVQCCGEKGLLGLVFHPDYENNGYFYVNYIDYSLNTVISRFEVSNNANIADPNSEKIMISFQQPYGNHNAGDLNFSPLDSLLYIALGDGGNGGDPGCRAQDTTTFIGKVLRIDVDVNINQYPYYGIPPGNLKDEIWAIGLRNPWRASFDRETGDYWIADVGQSTHEEINYVPAGSSSGLNFGWKIMEGTSVYDPDPISSNCPDDLPSGGSPAYYPPFYEMLRGANGANSISGGYVYRGCKYPKLNGIYFCTDYVTANSWMITSDGVGTRFQGAPNGATTYGEDRNGELYIANLNGNIYQLIDNSETKVLNLSQADYPLSGTYRAIEMITINDPLYQNLNGVRFVSPMVKLMNELIIPSSSSLEISADLCE